MVSCLSAGLGLAALVLAGCGNESGATAALRQPRDGATVAGGAALEMEADGVTIEAAGEAREGAGHFHVIVDDGCASAGTVLPKDADHVHFGRGQTAGTVYLAPGEHELCLQVGDGTHRALNVTDTITVTAAVRGRDEWCETIGQVDALITDADTNGEEFAARQVSYENARRLLLQLDAAIDTVDAEVRDDVAAALDVGVALTTAFVEADDDSVHETVQQIVEGGRPALEAASPWIKDTCGVDIDG